MVDGEHSRPLICVYQCNCDRYGLFPTIRGVLGNRSAFSNVTLSCFRAFDIRLTLVWVILSSGQVILIVREYYCSTHQVTTGTQTIVAMYLYHGWLKIFMWTFYYPGGPFYLRYSQSRPSHWSWDNCNHCNRIMEKVPKNLYMGTSESISVCTLSPTLE